MFEDKSVNMIYFFNDNKPFVFLIPKTFTFYHNIYVNQNIRHYIIPSFIMFSILLQRVKGTKMSTISMSVQVHEICKK